MDLFLRGGMGSTYTDACEAQRLSKVQQLNNILMEVCSKNQEVKKKKAMLMSRIAELSAKNEDIRRIESAENLNLVELKKIKESLESFKESIKTKMLEDKTANSGIPCSTAQNLSGNGIGQASSSVSSAAMTMFLEHGLRVDNAGPSHGKGKGLDMNLNLFEDGSYDHVEHMNPFVTPNASDADPSEPHRVPDDNKGFDMNLNLFEDGRYDCVPDDVKGTFAAEKESK